MSASGARRTPDVVVIGGGAAGCLAAYTAAEAGAAVVRREYRGKLTPRITSPGPMRRSCSKISLVDVALTMVTLSKIRLK